jgi:hypothetical protein
MAVKIAARRTLNGPSSKSTWQPAQVSVPAARARCAVTKVSHLADDVAQQIQRSGSHSSRAQRVAAVCACV